MRFDIIKAFFVTVLLLAAHPCTAAAAPADSAQAKAKLAAVRARISALTARLARELKERDALSANLRDADLEITDKRRRLEVLHADEASASKRRAELLAERAAEQRALDAMRASLAEHVRAAYMTGQQERLKLLLNQLHPADVGRMMTYYAYFAHARSEEIAEVDARVGHLEELVAEISRTAETLASLEQQAAREVDALEQARSERARTLAALGQKVSSGNQELEQLKREERAIESLVADLSRVMQDFPVDAQQSFVQMKGKLPWPVAGRLDAHYQDLRAGAEAGVRWNGVTIEAERGAKVRATYFGRVVYADWLQGLGLLMIIGHSGNYMTLYGHAEVLYKSVGDWVSPGDVIAALSDSGGASPQLYFEIRDGRKPVDPRIWLRGTP